MKCNFQIRRSPNCHSENIIYLYILRVMSVVFAVILLGSPLSANTLSPEQLKSLSEDIRKTCGYPSDRGYYFEVEGEVGASGYIIKYIGGQLSGKVSKTEWQGIQDVLEKDRAQDRISARDCAMKLTPIFFKAFGVDSESESLLEKETGIQEAFSSNNTAGRLVAFRKAFKDIRAFHIDLISANVSVSPREGQYERSLATTIKEYNYDTGEFSDGKSAEDRALVGQITQDSITFQNKDCSGNLRNIPETWIFRGNVSCDKGSYDGEFRLK